MCREKFQQLQAASRCDVWFDPGMIARISLKEGRLSAEDGTLAGAHLDMASAVRNAVRLAKLPLEDALCSASLTPARFLGLEHERGALICGARADMVALTSNLDVIGTWLGGAEQGRS